MPTSIVFRNLRSKHEKKWSIFSVKEIVASIGIFFGLILVLLSENKSKHTELNDVARESGLLKGFDWKGVVCYYYFYYYFIIIR
jgi:hypothetical protein